jgi:type II secretory pathway pseudopilin PulG
MNDSRPHYGRWAAGISGGVLVLIILLLILVPPYNRYQARANANNRVKVSNIEIRNQAQRVRIAKQQASIRYQQSVGIKRAQDEIRKTLTPLYVQFEMTQALQAIAVSGRNDTVIYLPTNPNSGLPVVPTSNTPAQTSTTP